MMPELTRAMRRNSLVLAGFAVATVGAVSLLHLLTEQRIAQAREAAQTRALNEILPADAHDNDLLASRQSISDPRLGPGRHALYIARQQDRATAAIFEVSTPEGYSGTIRLLVGIYADGRLAGVRALEHHETPGLGDNIETAKNDWILGFEGLSLSDPGPEAWAVKKDGGRFDQFAGATITPRAVVGAVRQTLAFFAEQGPALLEGHAGHHRSSFVDPTDQDQDRPPARQGVPHE